MSPLALKGQNEECQPDPKYFLGDCRSFVLNLKSAPNFTIFNVNMGRFGDFWGGQASSSKILCMIQGRRGLYTRRIFTWSPRRKCGFDLKAYHTEYIGQTEYRIECEAHTKLLARLISKKYMPYGWRSREGPLKFFVKWVQEFVDYFY